MGLPVEVNNLMLGSLGGYTVGRSLRFRSSASAYLNRTQTAGSQTTWTWSGWVKRGKLTTAQYLMQAGGSSGSGVTMSVIADDFQIETGNGTTQYYARTTAQYRDPSAWYHVVMVCNTTSATSTLTGTPSDRLQIWINGVQVTSFSASSIPTQNFAGYMNQNTVAANIGRWNGASPSYYYDGYLAEVNFIDGQALTPSSFGAYDTNGVWQPKKYTGTYGTNGFYLPFSLNTTATYDGSFNGSNQSIGITANSNFAFTTGNFTAECWFNSKSVASQNTLIDFWSNTSPSFITGQWQLQVNTSSQLVWFVATGASTSTSIVGTGASITLNTWNHAVVVRNGTTVTLYLNGVSVGSGTFSGTVGHSTGNGSIGRQTNNSTQFMNGNISNVRITNTAVYTSAFTPDSTPLTAISGTKLLTLQNSTLVDNSGNSITLTNNNTVTFNVAYPFSTGTSISNDASGNGNNWTPNNISLINGTTYDSMIDSPTNAAGTSTGIGNYAVLNPLYTAGGGTFSNGNLQVATGTSTAGRAIATMGVASGKWYWEITPTSIPANVVSIGFVPNPTTNDSGTVGNNASEYGYLSDGQKFSGGSAGAYGASYVANDVIGVALDLDARTLVFYKNGTSQGTAYSSIPLTNTYVPAVSDSSSSNSGTFVANFGQRPFTYTPPSGYKALNTYNLPAPSIANGAQYMAATTYTGNGSTQSISNAVNGVSFQPDLVWIKRRNTAADNVLYDSVRTLGVSLSSNLTNAEPSATNGLLTAFNSSGFGVAVVSSNNSTNGNADSYVAWQWKGGGTAVTNNSGTISSQVSANTSAGISIITYTGSGANATVGHGLGVAPSMIIFKRRDNTGNWAVYHTSVGNTAALYMNLTAAQSVNSVFFNNTSPTSSVFSIGTGTDLNVSGSTNVAYCFSAVSGYSAFGKYTGNGSADGPFIYTGFRPRWVMIKNTQDGTTNWYIYDTSRDTYNIMSNYLMSNLSNAEASFSAMDYLSNGFKIRTSNLNFNNSGQTHIYMAFAESPFQISRAR